MSKQATILNSAGTPEQAPIPSALVQLHERLDYLQAALTRLTDRLAPLVKHEPCSAMPDNSAPEGSCFTNALHTNIHQVQTMIGQVHYYDHILEL